MRINRMLGDWIAVEDVEVQTVNAAGLALAATKTDLCIGKVVHVGEGRRTASGEVMPMRVKPGDHVAYNGGMASEWPVPGSKMLVFQEAAVCSVVEVQ